MPGSGVSRKGACHRLLQALVGAAAPQDEALDLVIGQLNLARLGPAVVDPAGHVRGVGRLSHLDHHHPVAGIARIRQQRRGDEEGRVDQVPGDLVDGLVQVRGKRHVHHGEGVAGLVLFDAEDQVAAAHGQAREVTCELLVDLVL